MLSQQISFASKDNFFLLHKKVQYQPITTFFSLPNLYFSCSDKYSCFIITLHQPMFIVFS